MGNQSIVDRVAYRAIQDAMAAEALEAARQILAERQITQRLTTYQNDPVGFCKDILGDEFTPEVQQVMQSVVHNRITIARSGNAVGKSYAAARIALWFFLVYPDAQIFMTAAPPLDNLRRVLWGNLVNIRYKHPALFDGKVVRAMEIERHSTSFIAGVTIPSSGTPEEREAKFSGKHAPHLLFIVDEADAVPEEVFKGIEGCMSGGHDRMLMMFNPRAAVGTVWQKEVTRQAHVVKLSAIEHPNVVSGNNLFPGAVTRETTLRRINQWTRPLGINEKPDGECFSIPDYLVGCQVEMQDGGLYPPLEAGWRKIQNPAFSYMVLGEYPAQAENQLISQAWIDNARSRYDSYVSYYGETPPMGIRPLLGVDIAELGVDSNVACLRYGGFVSPLIVWKGMDTDATALKTLELYRKKNAHMAYIDGTGVGSSVAPAIARMGRSDPDPIRAVSVKIASKPSKWIKSELGEFYTLRDQLWWAVREWLRTDPGAMLPPDPMLLQELATPTYNVPNGKIRVTKAEDLRELLRRSPDRAISLCLTFTPQARPTIVRLSLA